MMRVRDLFAWVSDRDVESRRAATADLVQRVTGLIETLRVMCDARGNPVDAGAVDARYGHNHGYGMYGLALDCIGSDGVIERTMSGEEAELCGRHIRKQIAYVSGGFAPIAAEVNVGGPDVSARVSMHGHPMLDVRFLTDPGTIAVTVRMRVALAVVGEPRWSLKARVGVAAEFPMAVLAGADRSGEPGGVFRERSVRESAAFSLSSVGEMKTVTVSGVPVAPGRLNRLRVGLYSLSGVTALDVFELAVTAEPNNGEVG